VKRRMIPLFLLLMLGFASACAGIQILRTQSFIYGTWQAPVVCEDSFSLGRLFPGAHYEIKMPPPNQGIVVSSGDSYIIDTNDFSGYMNVSFESLPNPDHFDSFTVEVWLYQEGDSVLKGTFNMTSSYVVLQVGSDELYYYRFVFDTSDSLPPDASGEVSLSVCFTQ